MSCSISNCEYLFGKNAVEVFYNNNGKGAAEKTAFIDECLDLMMRINEYILTHKNGFVLIDPKASNNQCHLYALRAAQIQAAYSAKTEEERFAQTEENRFLHLSLFLSYSLAGDADHLIEVVKKTIHAMGVKKPRQYQRFEAFLRDKDKLLEKAARKALNRVFEQHLKEVLAQPSEENPRLRAELLQLAQENLQITSGSKARASTLYTYPKFAGVVHLVDVIAKEKIPFVIKVKVITKDGVAETPITAFRGEIQDDTPVLVFEGIATDGSFPFAYCRKEAKKCPSYFFRNNKAEDLHADGKNCFFCKKTTVDIEPYRQRLQQVMESSREMFYALGADFIMQNQKVFQPLFAMPEKYPLLSEMFTEAISKIEELGLGMLNPKTFTVCHVRMDTGVHALSDQLVIERSPQVFLKERGLL